jgi:sulfatase modifying factor 1
VDRLDLADERPLHKVRITKPFYFGQHEVTVAEFRKFVDSGYKPESVADGTGGYGHDPKRDVLPDKGEVFAGRDPKYSWQNPGFPQTEDHPVTNVTWNDAQAMCKWLSGKEGKKYRLPTEAEWEYACRAGTTTLFYSGNDPESLLKVANLYDADTAKNWPQWKEFALKGHDGYEFTSPVGKFAPNAFGLYDMHGNVWEWCADWYGEDYYAKSPVDDPQGPETGQVRVRRGGSWHTWPFYVRSSYRNWLTVESRYTLVGMRLVREE